MTWAASSLWKTVAYATSGLSSCYCGLRFVCSLGKCEDVSMEPTIQDGDFVLICPFYVNFVLLQKGDIVFCKSPKNPRTIICKRLVAMEGDTVFNNDKGYEEYVGKGHVWLEGDNKEASIDSRLFGALPYGLLISKVTIRLWPLNRFGFLNFPSTKQRRSTS
uniref:Peptidase S26 domain-containing protein n=1 Tax=Arion vulgaris TaxID=1028688 RepID=A0A0B6ZG40_9EUPU